MDLLTGNVKKIYWRYLTAAIGGSLVTSIYNMVDTIACGQYEGPNGTAALSTTQSIWTIMICVGILIGVGGGIMMSTCRGAGKKREGDEYFTVAITTGGVLAAVLTVLCRVFMEPLLVFSGADEVILPYAMAYCKWLTLAIPLFLLGILLGDFIRNDNAPLIPTTATIAGGVTNMIGDYYFVFVRDMGMEGAGLATMLGQVVSFSILFSYFFRKRCTVRLVKPTHFFKKLGKIITGGAAPCIIDMSFGIMVVLFNNQIRRYAGNSELAVFGAVGNLAILIQALFYGVGRSVQPLASTNRGAGQLDRVRESLGCGVVTGVVLGALFWLVPTLLPEQILRLYMDVTPEVLVVGPRILRIYAVSFLLLGVNVVISYYLQAILQRGASFLVSLLRGVIFCSFFILLLPLLFGFDSIWWSMPLTELCTCLTAVLLLKKRPVTAEKKEK